jgi:hypothetical protein
MIKNAHPIQLKVSETSLIENDFIPENQPGNPSGSEDLAYCKDIIVTLH